MSTIDTLAYGVRTAGVLTRRLAISLALFNVLVIVSRLGNMIQAPIIGNLPDKVFRGAYTTSEVLAGLRIDVCFIIAGVVFGGLLTPSFINIARRGIALVEERGSMPATILHGMRRLYRLPSYMRSPFTLDYKRFVDIRGIPLPFLVWNIFVTAFYSIGVMSTVLAASWDHNVSGTAILLSGIVNGIATMLLFLIVDPPAAVVIDQCISGKRPESHAKTMNLFLVITRMLGCILALVMLPPMGHYVLGAAHFVDRMFPAQQEAVSSNYVAEASCSVDGLGYHLRANETKGLYTLELIIKNPGEESKQLEFPSGARVEFAVKTDSQNVWSSHEGLRFTQAIEHETIPAQGELKYSTEWLREQTEVPADAQQLWFAARIHTMGQDVTLCAPVHLEGGDEK